MSSLWVVGASQMASAGLNLFNEVVSAQVGNAFARANAALEQRQIREASRFEAQQRIRQTGALIGAQRARLGSAGVVGGRTARLLEANARMAASRQREQAGMRDTLQMTASRMRQLQTKTQGRMRVIGAGQNLLAAGVDFMEFKEGLPPDG